MQCITLGVPDVARFAPVGPDQHVKPFFPRRPGGPIAIPVMPEDGDVGRWYGAYLQMPDDDRPWMRSYTHDPGTRRDLTGASSASLGRRPGVGVEV
jgi:NADPH-dependent ferric siderophore reductase